MKKWFICLMFLIPAYVYHNPVYGQLNGTYVIGTAPSDYLNLATAVSSLNSNGISGNVVFDIKPGIYNEQISINQFSGAGAAFQVRFQSQNGDSTSVTIQYPSSSNSANNYVIQLNGADYVSFDKITIKRTDTLKYCNVIDFSESSRKNKFTNCIIEGNANQGNTQVNSAVIGSNNSGYKSFNTFQNNIIRYGSYGLFFAGQGSNSPDSCLLVQYNKFINQSIKGIHIQYHRFAYIDGNDITNSTSNNTYTALYLQYANDTSRILKNRIALTTGYGINISNCNETITANTLIANNFIAIGGTSNAIGFYILNSRRLYFLYNSVHIYNTVTIQGSCIHINGSTTDGLTVKNNIFANDGTGQGYTYYVSGTTNAPIAKADYNNLFVNSGQYIAYWKTAGVTSLANWRTASSADSNSFIANPEFTSPTDLHSEASGIDGMATTNLSPFNVSTDIDGDLRDLSNPDVGADEFIIKDLGASSIELPSFGAYCAGTPFNIKIFIKNYGSSTYNGDVPVHYQFGTSSVINETAMSLSIPAGDSVLYTFSNTEIITATGAYALHAATDLASDNFHSNDTINKIIHIAGLPVAGFTYLPSFFEVSFTNTSSSADSFLWDFGDGDTSTKVNPLHTYNGVGNFNVRLIASNSCEADTTAQLIFLTGIEEVSKSSCIDLWPNPASGGLNVSIGGDILVGGSLAFYNSSGVAVLNNRIFSGTRMTVDVSSWSPGLYFIMLEIEGKIISERVLVNN